MPSLAHHTRGPRRRRLTLTYIAGPAKVVNCHTLEVDGQRIRLHGSHAPEGRQTCRRDTVTWLCGAEAAKALRLFIDGRQVTCRERDIDRYGRIVAVCHAGGQDLNGRLVAEGMALAYRRYSTDYVDEEEAARGAGNGLWAGWFVPPWELRRGTRLPAIASEPARYQRPRFPRRGCVAKCAARAKRAATRASGSPTHAGSRPDARVMPAEPPGR